MLQSQGGLANERTGAGYRQRAVLFDELREVHPLDIFHRQIVSIANLIGVKKADDVVVSKLCSGLGLTLETSKNGFVGQQTLPNHLERYDPAQAGLPGFEYLTHATLAQLVEDDVGSQNQLRTATIENLLGLIESQPVELYEVLEKFEGIGVFADELSFQLRELVGTQHGRFTKTVEHLIDRIHDH